jgi:DNA-binding response OmpR family regulator
MDKPMKSKAEVAQKVILLVEDDPEMRSLICDELWDMGFRIVEAADGDQALKQIAEANPDLILTDLRMPAGGLDYICRLQTVASGCPIILMTAYGSAQTRADAARCGVAAYFDKPVRMEELKAAIRNLLNHGKSQ